MLVTQSKPEVWDAIERTATRLDDAVGLVVLAVSNQKCCIVQCPGQYLTWLDWELRYKSPVAVAMEGGWQPPGAEEGERVWDGYVRMLRQPKSFACWIPTGLTRFAHHIAEKRGLRVELIDTRAKPEFGFPEPVRWPFEFRDYQRRAIEAALAKGRGVIDIPPRGGKCLKLGTKVLSYDGRQVSVENVRVGDWLMGPDSKPRRVLATTRGRGPLFEIRPTRGESWVCNDVHVLTLVNTDTDNVVDVPLDAYLGTKSKWFRERHKQFSVGVDYPPQERLPLDPYFLGVWFGDGTKCLKGVSITKPDPEIRRLCEEVAECFDLRVRTHEDRRTGCFTYSLTCGKNGGVANPLLDLLRSIVGCDATVPHRYLVGSRTERLQFLAGWLDTDGYLHNGGYEIAQKRVDYADAIVQLARSLGLSTTRSVKQVNGEDYHRVFISGDCSVLPLRIPRKQAPKRIRHTDPTRTAFTVYPLGEGDYAGFELDGDGRFLLGDFTVTHNTSIGLEIHRCMALPTAWTAPTDRIVRQTVEAATALFGRNYAHHQEGTRGWEVAAKQQLVIMTAATASNLPQEFWDSRQALIIDEFHHGAAKTYHDIAALAGHIYYRIGLTGTFFRSGDDELALHALLANRIAKIESAELLRQKVLVPTRVLFVPMEGPGIRVSKDGGYHAIRREGVEANEQRNKTAAYAVQQLDRLKRRVLVLVATKHQGRELTSLIRSLVPDAPAGCEHRSVEFVSTDMDRPRISRILKSFVDKQEVRILIGTSLVGEGVDLPSADALVYAAGGKAEVSLTQNAYRVCTANEGKTESVIIDFADRQHRTLIEHSVERLKVYADDPVFRIDAMTSARELPGWFERLAASYEKRDDVQKAVVA